MTGYIIHIQYNLLWATPQKHYKKYLNVTILKWNFFPVCYSVSSLISSTAGRWAFASRGPAWRSGAAGTSESRGALDSGEGHAAARGPPLQTQHHHLLHEAQVDPYALEAWPQGRLRRGGAASRGESGVWGVASVFCFEAHSCIY